MEKVKKERVKIELDVAKAELVKQNYEILQKVNK